MVSPVGGWSRTNSPPGQESQPNPRERTGASIYDGYPIPIGAVAVLLGSRHHLEQCNHHTTHIHYSIQRVEERGSPVIPPLRRRRRRRSVAFCCVVINATERNPLGQPRRPGQPPGPRDAETCPGRTAAIGLRLMHGRLRGWRLGAIRSLVLFLSLLPRQRAGLNRLPASFVGSLSFGRVLFCARLIASN